MKKILIIMIPFVLLSAMVACGSSNTNTDNNQISGSRSEIVSDEVETPATDFEEEPDETETSMAATSNNETEPEENVSEQPEGSSILIAYVSGGI